MRKHKIYRELTIGEEIVNSITHGIGVLLSIAALVLLVVFAAIKGNAWHVVSFTIFGSSMVLLYLSSTLYHSFTKPKIKNLFARFDHGSYFHPDCRHLHSIHAFEFERRPWLESIWDHLGTGHRRDGNTFNLSYPVPEAYGSDLCTDGMDVRRCPPYYA